MQDKIKLSDYSFSVLQIETKTGCNMKCKFCPEPLRKVKGITLSDDDVYKAIDVIDAHDSKLEYLCFSGYNEPLMDPRIFKFIEYAKGKKFGVLIPTNGLLFNSDEVKEKLIEAEPTYIKISFHTLTEEAFLKSRGINYSFKKYKENIFDFLRLAAERQYSSEIDIDVACNFVSGARLLTLKLIGLPRGDPSVPNSTREIKQDLLAFIKELSEYHNSFIFDKKDIIRKLKLAEDKRYLEQSGISINKNIKIKIKPFSYGRRQSDFYKVNRHLGCSTRILTIYATGSVSPCCLDFNDRLSMGNIKEESLVSILDRNRDFISGIRNGTISPEVCKRCHGAPTRRGALYLNVRTRLRNFIQTGKTQLG